jgi:hypothetical protein
VWKREHGWQLPSPRAFGGVEGVYAEAPLRGMLIWNSHAFNVTDRPGKLDIWVNLEFAAPEEQRYPQESLLYTSLSYADPAVARFDPPRLVGGRLATDVERTLTHTSARPHAHTSTRPHVRTSARPSRIAILDRRAVADDHRFQLIEPGSAGNVSQEGAIQHGPGGSKRS